MTTLAVFRYFEHITNVVIFRKWTLSIFSCAKFNCARQSACQSARKNNNHLHKFIFSLAWLRLLHGFAFAFQFFISHFTFSVEWIEWAPKSGNEITNKKKNENKKTNAKRVITKNSRYEKDITRSNEVMPLCQCSMHTVWLQWH